MGDIVWEDPPQDRRSHYGRHAKIAAELKAHPGQWAKIMTDANVSHTALIKNGGVKAYQPAGSFEAVARNSRTVDGRTRCDVYARYIGNGPGSASWVVS